MSWDANSERYYILQMLEEDRISEQTQAGKDALARSAARIRAYAARTANPKPRNAIPASLDDRVTPRQLAHMRGIANPKGLDAEAVCLEEFKLRPEEINKTAASWLIDQLKSMKCRQVARTA